MTKKTASKKRPVRKAAKARTGVVSRSSRRFASEIRETVDRTLSRASDRDIERLAKGGTMVIERVRPHRNSGKTHADTAESEWAAVINLEARNRAVSEEDSPDEVLELGERPRRNTAAVRAKLKEGIARARESGTKTVEKILSEDDMISASEVANRLKLTRQSVHVKRRENKILALTGAKRAYFFPDWQITGLTILDGLSDVLEAFAGDAWGAYLFLWKHHPETDGLTALEGLQMGRKADVLAAVENMGRSFS